MSRIDFGDEYGLPGSSAMVICVETPSHGSEATTPRCCWLGFDFEPSAGYVNSGNRKPGVAHDVFKCGLHDVQPPIKGMHYKRGLLKFDLPADRAVVPATARATCSRLIRYTSRKGSSEEWVASIISFCWLP